MSREPEPRDLRRQRPPEGGAPRPFVLPEGETWALPNGLKVTLVPWGMIPKVTVRLVLRSGSIDEGPDEVWLSDLVGELMQEGTLDRSAREVAESAARMGGELVVATGLDQVAVTGDVLSEFAADIVRLIADVVQNPQFPSSELPRLRQDLRRELAVARQEPDQLTLERFRAVLYPGHPYGRTLPTDAALAGYSLEQVQAFHAANFGAGRATLYAVGRFDSGEVRRAVEDSFGGWAAGAPARLAPPVTAPRPEVHVIDRPGAPQSTLMLGLPVPDPSRPEWVGLQVTNALLGGSFASRITSNIREDKGYTYSPRASLSVRYRDAYWVEEADVATEVTGASLTEINAEIRRLAEEEPPEAELGGIANYLAGTFVLQNSTRQGILGQKIFLDLHGLPEEYLRTWVARVHATTPSEVSRLTREFLVPERMLTVITGDRAKVEGQLAPAPAAI